MKELKSILGVALSNITTILSGIIISFIVPKIMSLSGYGLYRTFSLYEVYLGVFHLGIIDGIFLKYGDKDYEELDRPMFRSYFRYFLLLNLFFCVLAIAGGVLIFGISDMGFILVSLGLNVIAFNATAYFQHISQFTRRFKEYSARKVIQSAVNIAIVAAMVLLYLNNGEVDYRGYIIALVTLNYVLMGWYVFTYRDIVFGKSAGLGRAGVKSVMLPLIKKGFPLLVSNLCVNLLLVIDRQFVNILFTTEEYAIYAFAYNMLSLVAFATTAVSTVLYPLLKRRDSERSMELYPQICAAVLVMVFIIMTAYFPLTVIIGWFLPKYTGSLSIFRIILPGIAVSSAVTVIMNNYYKVFDMVTDFFKKSVVVLALSIAANLAAYMIFGTMESISVASIAVMLFWYLFTETRLSEAPRAARIKNFAFMIVMMAGFYAASMIGNVWLGMAAYIVICAGVVLVFYLRSIRKWIDIVRIRS